MAVHSIFCIALILGMITKSMY
jgi:hypothetical protein